MPQPRRVLLTLLAAGMVGSLAPFAIVPAAEACVAARDVKRYVPPPGRPPLPSGPQGVIDQAGEKILFIQDGDRTTAHIQVQYFGNASDFSWIVPVQAQPTLGVGSDDLFTALRAATKPSFELNYRTEGTCKERPSSGSGGAMAGAPASKRAPAPAAAPNAGVTIVSQEAVGPYDATILKADDLGSLRRWLDDNAYVIPGNLDAATADYITSKYYFVALKLQKDREAGDLQPIVLSYEAPKPSLPIRLTSLSAVPDMDVFVWFLGKQRAVPENYDHVEINEARIDWINGGNNYRQVVTEAMNEADGRAFVTDYAGPSSVLKLPAGLTQRAKLDVGALAGQAEPGAFARALKAQAFFPDQARLVSFLARYVPKPAAHQDVPDATFYGDLAAGGGTYAAALAGTTVDTAKAAAELRETALEPARAIVEALEDAPYLTQLYTTLSPDEMVQDPQFVFNADMGKVPNVREADAITVCTPDYYREDAPLKLKLADGTTFYVTEGNETTGGKPSTGGGKAVKVPAMLTRRTCGTVGPGRSVANNQNAVSKLLDDLSKQGIALRISTAFGANPREGAGATIVLSVPFAAQLAEAARAASGGGFGCAGCSANNTPPVRTGSGEGGTYALVFAGFLGYRRWLSRPRKGSPSRSTRPGSGSK